MKSRLWTGMSARYHLHAPLAMHLARTCWADLRRICFLRILVLCPLRQQNGTATAQWATWEWLPWYLIVYSHRSDSK